jgi:hypothetical protein
VEDLARRIRREFDEVPGLDITVKEGARFWTLDEATCAEVLHALRDGGFLTRTTAGRYRRRDDGLTGAREA